MAKVTVAAAAGLPGTSAAAAELLATAVAAAVSSGCVVGSAGGATSRMPLAKAFFMDRSEVFVGRGCRDRAVEFGRGPVDRFVVGDLEDLVEDRPVATAGGRLLVLR